uniref:Coiled-coil domain-containing protein 88B n=2 Tax=Anthurium amnicola TaxID=1678845 RepID=A0A1D1YY63_9ARAE
MPPKWSPPKHRHDGTSPLPLGMDWSDAPSRRTGKDTVRPHDPRTGWSYCVTIPSWSVQPDSGTSNGSLINPIVFYVVQVGVQAPDGKSYTRRILRRFSDFRELFSALKKSFPKKKIPPAPSKHFFLRINSSQPLLEERRYALEEWMRQLLSDINLSRSVHVASFLELEAAARSSFQDLQDGNMNNSDTNPSDSVGLSSSFDVWASAGASVSSSLVASTSHSLASDCGSDHACETSVVGSPRHESVSNYETCNEDQALVQFCSQSGTVMKHDVQVLDNDPSAGEVISHHPDVLSKPIAHSGNVLKASLFSGDRVDYTNDFSRHARRISSESVGSDISSVRGSELSNTGLTNSLGDNFVDFSGGEGPVTMEALNSMDPRSSGINIILPLDQRHKLNRILVTMQRRLVTAKTDMEDLIARLNQEIAVKEYLATKVKDLEGELESTRQKSKENLQQAILVERERVTQMQWDMDELRRKTLEMESRLNSEESKRMNAESEKVSAISEKEMLMQDLDTKKELLVSLRKRLEDVEIKSKGDIKVLIKEVKSLRNSQVEMKEILNQSMKEKAELERALQKERQRWEDAKLAKKKLLHECGILRHRLEDCSVNLFAEEDDKFTGNPSSLADALDLLTTSDNRIGLLLAEAQLLARDDESAVMTSGKVQSKDPLGNKSTMNGEDPRAADHEVRKMLTDVFIDNAILKKQVNSITRCAIKTAFKAEKEDSDGIPVRKTVLTKLLER